MPFMFQNVMFVIRAVLFTLKADTDDNVDVNKLIEVIKPQLALRGGSSAIAIIVVI